jgi:hypothetical protein
MTSLDIAPRRRWTEWLYYFALAVLGAVLLAAICFAIARSATGRPVPLANILGSFLIGFGLLKFSVATDAVLRMRDTSDTGLPNPVETHGSAPMAWSWIIYRYVAAAVSFAVAIYTFTAAAERVNSFLTH